MPKRRLEIALAAYAVLALAAYGLLEGRIRLVTWIVLAGLALKTLAVDRLRQYDNPPAGRAGRDDDPPPPDSSLDR